MRRLFFSVVLLVPGVRLIAQGVPATARASVTVIVSQQGSGVPIGQATITVSPIGPDSANRIVRTDVAGRARVEAIPVGQVFVNAVAAGYVSISMLYPVTATGSDTVRLSLNPLGAKGARTEADCRNALVQWGFPPTENACALFLKSQTTSTTRGGVR